MAILTEDGVVALLDYLFKRSGCELALAVDSSLTECTDPAYSRVALPDFLGTTTTSGVTNDTSFTFDTGEQVVSYWFVVDPLGDAIVYDVLPSPQVGEFRFPIGALRFETISG
jgi:hypothetical protein